jgi:hypothetical protein
MQKIMSSICFQAPLIALSILAGFKQSPHPVASYSHPVPCTAVFTGRRNASVASHRPRLVILDEVACPAGRSSILHWKPRRGRRAHSEKRGGLQLGPLGCLSPGTRLADPSWRALSAGAPLSRIEPTRTREKRRPTHLERRISSWLFGPLQAPARWQMTLDSTFRILRVTSHLHVMTVTQHSGPPIFTGPAPHRGIMRHSRLRSRASVVRIL